MNNVTTSSDRFRFGCYYPFYKRELLKYLTQDSTSHQYKYVILSIVYDRELSRDSSTKAQIDNQIRLLKNIQIIPWKPDSNIIKEFARLNKTKGTGESACLAYCKFHNNVLASSNLKDTKEYCRTENITYLTTLDFLWYAKKNKVMTEKECNDFIQTVISKNSILPNISITIYTPTINFL